MGVFTAFCCEIAGNAHTISTATHICDMILNSDLNTVSRIAVGYAFRHRVDEAVTGLCHRPLYRRRVLVDMS